jgi:hypothetical protein
MRVFAEGLLSEDEQEAFDIATTEIVAYFSPKLRVNPEFVQNAEPPLACSGIWVFIRYGCQVVWKRVPEKNDTKGDKRDSPCHFEPQARNPWNETLTQKATDKKATWHKLNDLKGILAKRKFS